MKDENQVTMKYKNQVPMKYKNHVQIQDAIIEYEYKKE